MDLIISRKCQFVIAGSPGVDRLFSHHFLVVCGLQMPKPVVSVKEHTYRNLKVVESDLRSDLRNSELSLDPPILLRTWLAAKMPRYNLVSRVSRARRDFGRVWSRASVTIENTREGSSLNKEFVALSFVEFKARLIASRCDSAITCDVLQ